MFHDFHDLDRRVATQFCSPTQEALVVASDGWESLKGRPPNWEAPEQLRGPTASAAINLAVQMMGSNMIGNDVIDVVAEFVSAKARIELWMPGRLGGGANRL